MDPASLEFARPVWLYAGLGLCVLAVVLWGWFDRRREADLARLVHARFRARLLPGLSRGLLWSKRGLWLAGGLLLCTAAAGPRVGYEWREVRQRGIDLLFAVDTSRSMLAEDLSPNRLERARMGIQDFVERLHGDRVGLIPFAGSSYAMCPLTTDYDAFRQSLRTLTTDLIPRQGTDVASAIREAKRLFDEQKHNHRILVLMTDGEDFQEDVDVAIHEAEKDGMTIYTIGVGSAEGGQIPIPTPQGFKDFVRDEAGQPVVTKLDEATLRKIADATGGLYAPLGRGAEGLEMIYKEKLRLMPKEERERGMEKVPLERFGWPLAAGLLLLLVEFLLPDRRREARARSLPSAARRHATVSVFALILAGLTGEVRAEADPRALYNAGTAAYEKGDFKTAADSLRASLITTDLKLQSQAYYNLGNANYRLGQAAMQKEPEKVEETWKAAVKAYDDALALNAGDDDSRYNRDLVQRKLNEMKKQKDQKDQKGGDKKDDDQKEDQKDQKEQDGQKPQDQQNQDGQKQDNQKQDGQKQDGQKQDGQKQDGQKQDGQKQDGQKQDGQKQDGQKQDGQQQDGQKQDGQQQNESDPKNPQAGQDAASKEGEKKEGEKKEAGSKEGEKNGDKKEDGTRMEKEGKNSENKTGEQKNGEQKQNPGEQSKEGDQKDAQAQEGNFGERRQPGAMTAEEARQLLKTMRVEEATVLPFDKLSPRQQRYTRPESNTKGKTW